MEKLSRKRSPDQLQEHLRQNKDTWNKRATLLIGMLIELKRALNGRGSKMFNLPPSNIKDPLPSELVSFLSELTSNYSTLAQEASSIMQEQQHYSETRRKPAEPKIATASAKETYVVLGDAKLPTLLAITPEQQEQGLKGVEWPPPVMSFIYAAPQFVSFWMHRTPSPLDIVFALNGKITNIRKGEPFSTKLINGGISDLVIELPFGTCEKMGITVGHPVQLLK